MAVWCNYSGLAENAIAIESWFENPADQALLNLLPVLAALRHVHDVRSILSLRTAAHG